ncbi:DUF481 domain-containing protein [Haliangium sp.]|uniref:DUF481 domain-containing protein n=1 Tax=Haliangium sp. TaxID=2663208 RepID=UPI003D10BA29
MRPSLLASLVSGALAVAFVAGPATAGIVNVQSVVSAEAEEGLTGSVTASVDFRRGNTSRLVLSAAPVLRYRADRQVFIVYGSGEYDEDNDAIRKVFGHGRYRYIISPRLTAEVFTQGETNPGQGQDLRLLAGAGPLLQLLDSHGLRLAWGVAYMFEHERVTPDEDGLDAQHRVSSYLSSNYQLKDNLQLIETVYVQPRITDPGDLRLLNETQLSVSATTYLALNLSFNFAYDTEPSPRFASDGVTEREKYDSALKMSLTVQF